MGLGISVSNTKSSMLPSFTPTKTKRHFQIFAAHLTSVMENLLSFLTFETDCDGVVVTHQIPTWQQFRNLGGMRSDHIPHPIAHYTIRIQAQTGQWVHPEHILLNASKTESVRPWNMATETCILFCKRLNWHLKQASYYTVQHIPLSLAADANGANQILLLLHRLKWWEDIKRCCSCQK